MTDSSDVPQEQPGQRRAEGPAQHRAQPWWTMPPSGSASGPRTWRPDPITADTTVLPRPHEAGRGRRGASLVVAAALAAGLIGGGVGAGVTYGLTDHGGSGGRVVDSLSQPHASGGQPAADSTSAASVAQVAQHLLPSVVSITVRSGNSGDEGTGVIISSDGRILTNNHVVEAAANGGSIAVTFNDGSTTRATIVGRDPTSDLAVIKAQDVSGLTVARLGRSADLVVGQQVVAIGSPFGLSGTVTSGIVSALNRPVCTANCGNPNATPTVLDAIQTDAAINPGNSGGPLVDMSGAVVGINSAIRATSTIGGEAGNVGVGFAIPIDEARRIAQELIDNGVATHAVMGVTVTDFLTEAGTPGGAQLKSVLAGQAADKAGLKAGDVVVQFDKRRIDDADALVAAVHAAEPGSTVTITYLRDGGKHTTDLTLGSQ